MIEKVLKTIFKYNLIQNKDKVVLGVSGGPDSLSMLDILNTIQQDEKIDFEIIVAHINHQIREEANSEEEFVRDFCKQKNIKFYSKRIDVAEYANNSKIGLEEAGRKLRYDFFYEVINLENANKIAIAHNKNDKIETIIMNELRGSGLVGLKGIEPIRNNIIRPLIECERAEIEKYCEENNLQPRIDKSNFENEYTRNKIRNVVIPYIKKEFNPNIIETINRLSEVVNETETYLQEETLKKYESLKISDNNGNIILNLKKFNQENILIRKRILMYTISKTLGNLQDIEKANIEDLIKLCENNIGNKFLMPNKNIKVLVNKGKIFFEALN